MEYITLPRTELKVSRICLGCWQMNGGVSNVNWDAQSYEVSKACVDKALEVGINFFDTAEGYAGSEEVLGKCLQGRRQDAVIATKFGFREGIHTPPYTAVQIDEAITRALRKLQTTYIDLLQAHFASFIADIPECMEELKRQVSLGRLKNFGVCNFGPKNLKVLLDGGCVPVSNQIGYNLLWRSAELEIMPICKENDISVLAYSPLQQGVYTQIGYNLLWRSAELEIMPICKENDISVLAYSPLQQGLLTGNFMKVEDVPLGRRRGKLFSMESCNIARHGQPGCEKEVFESIHAMKDICAKADVPMSKASLSWVLQQFDKSCVIVGCRTPEQVVENSKIVKLSSEVVNQLTAATESVKVKVGTALDQWATPDRCE